MRSPRLRLSSEEANVTRREEPGQGLVEYALIIAFIALGCVGALQLLGPAITSPLGGVLAGF